MRYWSFGGKMYDSFKILMIEHTDKDAESTRQRLKTGMTAGEVF